MEKRFNYRIYPTVEQQEQIQRNFGCVRFVYNYFLSKRLEKYKAGESFYSFYDACKDLTQLKKQDGYTWLCDADAGSLQIALKNMDNAYSEFFRRLREKSGAPGFPHFKTKRGNRQSYTSKAHIDKNDIYITENKVRLPKLGLVRCSVSRPVEGRILSASVFQTPSGKYFVSVCCTDIEREPLAPTGKAVGIHFGIKTLATTSDGDVFENHRYLEKSQKQISRLQRSVSRKPKGSANHEKARVSLAKAYERVKNRKTDMLHKLTTEIVREYDTICVRDEELARMVQRRQYAYYLSDASWGEFAKQLCYKCGWYGRTLIEIDAKFPSAQICSRCGYKNALLSEKPMKEWVCPVCSARHDRARNAATNTLGEGLRVLTAAS